MNSEAAAKALGGATAGVDAHTVKRLIKEGLLVGDSDGNVRPEAISQFVRGAGIAGLSRIRKALAAEAQARVQVEQTKAHERAALTQRLAAAKARGPEGLAEAVDICDQLLELQQHNQKAE